MVLEASTAFTESHFTSGTTVNGISATFIKKTTAWGCAITSRPHMATLG
ncbi:4479_t:CDS:1, partial [Cetraspora pellucida]